MISRVLVTTSFGTEHEHQGHFCVYISVTSSSVYGAIQSIRFACILSLTPRGKERNQLKTPYRDGTAHVIFDPLELMSHIQVRTQCGRPAVVQIDSPADLPSPSWLPQVAQTESQPHPVSRRLRPQTAGIAPK
jgi:hypothetical protein